MLTYAQIMGLRRESRYAWTRKDSIIYALGAGMPDDPLDERQLAYVYEPRQVALPSLIVTLGFNDGVMDEIGFNYAQVLHGEQAITLHKVVPPEGEVAIVSRMIGAWDKGVGKGAVFAQEAVLTLAGEAEPMATVRTTAFARADGGFGGPGEGQPPPHAVPDRAPDHSVTIPTARNQALLYRLSGDTNPLHADPATARAAGFDQPILHGLCSYALCLRAVLATCCDYDAARIAQQDVRFSAPVFPGDEIVVDLWRDGDVVSFIARVPDRGVTVIRNGRTVLRQGS